VVLAQRHAAGAPASAVEIEDVGDAVELALRHLERVE
jgi:hypothetical protein